MVVSERGISIFGDGAGWADRNAGTIIAVKDSSIGTLLTMDGGFLHLLHGVNLHGDEKADTVLQFGDGTLDGNDWQIYRSSITHGASRNVNVLN